MREVVRCRHCHLNQFLTESGACRKCRQALSPQSEPVPDVQPVAELPKTKKIIIGKFDIGFAVKLVREANGLSQGELAERMECPRTWLSKIENDSVLPGLAAIERLAWAMDTTPYVLVTIAEARCAA